MHNEDNRNDQQGGHDRILYLHTDHLGTPRLATDQNQHLVWRWQGRAFGDSEPETGEQLRADNRNQRAKRESQQDRDDHDDQSGVVINLRFLGQYYDQMIVHDKPTYPNVLGGAIGFDLGWHIIRIADSP